MKNVSRALLSALLFSLPSAGAAGEVRIYQLDLRGPVPDLARFQAALDENAMPGVAVFSGPVQEDGRILIDRTRGDIPSPDVDAREPRRLGVLIDGQLTAGTKEVPQKLISFKIRDCRHSAYLFSEGSKKFHASWTESSMDVSGKIGADGWGLVDTDPQSKEARQVFVVRVME